MIELGQRNLAASSFGPDDSVSSVADQARMDAKAWEERAAAMDAMATERMEMYRIETEGEEAVRLAMEKTQETLNESTEFVREAARNIQDALGDGLYDLMQGNFDSIGKSFKSMLDRMVANAIAADLGKYLLGDIGKTGEVGGLAAKLLDFLPKFAMGTPYVPQTGLAVVHQGERIIPAEQNRGGFGGTINVYVSSSNAPDVRRAAGQGAREALSAFAGAQRYG